MTDPESPTTLDEVEQTQAWELTHNIVYNHLTGHVFNVEEGDTTRWTFQGGTVGGRLGAPSTRKAILRMAMIGYYRLEAYNLPQNAPALRAAGKLLWGDPCHVDPLLILLTQTPDIKNHTVRALDPYLPQHQKHICAQILDTATQTALNTEKPKNVCSV